MPKHDRQLLRESIIAQLIGTAPNYRTAAGPRVNKSREQPAFDTELPLISVYSLEEPIDESSKGTAPRELKRMTSVAIVGWVAASENVDDALDALALEIETAMDVDPNLDGYAFDSILENTQMAITEGGETPLGAVSLTYSCTYHTQVRRELPTDDFTTAGATTNLGGTQDTDDQTERVVTIP